MIDKINSHLSVETRLVLIEVNADSMQKDKDLILDKLETIEERMHKQLAFNGVMLFILFALVLGIIFSKFN